MHTGETHDNNSHSSEQEAAIPLHLVTLNWLDFERDTAAKVADNVASELYGLSKKATVKRVHDTRVALRQWVSIWQVLKRDGWKEKKSWKKLGKKLQQLQKLLGELRDWDVNLETAKSFDIPDAVHLEWSIERAKVSKRVSLRLRELDLRGMSKELPRFVEKRFRKLKKELRNSGSEQLFVSAYAHLNPYLEEQEEATRLLEEHACEPESLHRLRLCIKSWRYLLTEFFGLTNLQLVRAQQLLGRYNDASRALNLLEQWQTAAQSQAAGQPQTEMANNSQVAKDAVQRLESYQGEILKEFTEIRSSLPFGLRPSVRSFPDASRAASERTEIITNAETPEILEFGP